MKRTIYVVGLIACIFLLEFCSSSTNKVVIDITAEPFEKLSSYQFFEGDLKAFNPTEKVLPYELISPLFSDFAKKARFVYMPEGKSANYTTDGVLDFPVGTVLIKNFYYDLDERNPNSEKLHVETRLLVKRKDKWDALSYIWNEEQTEASLEVVGGIKEVSWINPEGETMKFDYIIPNKNQCKGCHSYDQKLQPIGPKVRNLNTNISYAEGNMNQLEKWATIGYLDAYDPTADHPKVAQWDNEKSGTLHERAMAYLDINCAHCHNPHGPANTSGLTLNYDQKADMTLGIYKSPVATGRGSGGHSYSIIPGNADKSIMVYRMQSDDPAAMMPELGRRLVHDAGVELIRDWINEMEAIPKPEY